MQFLNFFLFLWAIFAFLDSESGSGSTHLTDRIRNTDFDTLLWIVEWFCVQATNWEKADGCQTSWAPGLAGTDINVVLHLNWLYVRLVKYFVAFECQLLGRAPNSIYLLICLFYFVEILGLSDFKTFQIRNIMHDHKIWIAHGQSCDPYWH